VKRIKGQAAVRWPVPLYAIFLFITKEGNKMSKKSTYNWRFEAGQVVKTVDANGHMTPGEFEVLDRTYDESGIARYRIRDVEGQKIRTNFAESSLRPLRKCRIYQIDLTIPHGLAFMTYKAIQKKGYEKPNLDWYDIVFDGPVSSNELGNLFKKFSDELSNGKYARPLSVSDIFELYDDNTSEFFYRDADDYVKVEPMGELERTVVEDYVVMLGEDRYYLRLANEIEIFDKSEVGFNNWFSIEPGVWKLSIDKIESILSRHGFTNILQYEKKQKEKELSCTMKTNKS
jgi:hypothetical protein